MPYTISEATDPLKIKEQEYASAKKIMFTAFTSCIGVTRSGCAANSFQMGKLS